MLCMTLLVIFVCAGAVGIRVRRHFHARSDHEGGRLRIRLSPGRLLA